MTISQILTFMQTTADEEYRGDVQNHALAIFNRLSPGDKRTFLRKSLILHWERQIDLAKKGMQDVVIDKELRIDRASVEAERQSIKDVNYEEQIRLRTWVMKLIMTVGLLGFIGTIAFSYFITGTPGSPATSLLKHISTVITFFF